MNAFSKTIVLGVAVATLSAAPVFGHGFGGPGGPGGMGGRGTLFPTLLRALDLSAEQKSQVEQIMARHRQKVEPLLEQLRASHDELTSKLLGTSTVTNGDVSPAVAHIAQLQQQVMQEWVSAALEARAVLTPDQLAKAGQIKRQLDSLRSQMQALLGPPGMGGPLE
jgi:Spy/CpxP family protein refolding chaperone